MSSRAQHLSEQEGGREIHISLLSRVLSGTGHLACVRADSIDDDQYLTALTQFDVLSNIVAVDGSGRADDRVFYPNFARFRQTRIQSVVDRLVSDPEMRQILFPRNDEDLALALNAIAKVAHEVGFRYDGFWSWDRTPVADFIAAHPPEQPQTS